MKKILLALLLVVLTSIVILFSCKRDKDCENCTVNTPPVAKAGADFITSLPNVNVVLDGSYSSDADGKIVKWLWTKISGPAAHEIMTKDSAITFVRNFVEGTYQFQLEITDNGGLSAKDTVSLVVLSENRPPKAVAGADLSIALPYCGARGSANLDGGASNDPDNNIANYLWTKISGPPARLLAITTTNLKIDDMVAGTYALELAVVDSRGLVAKDTVIIQVTQPVPQPYDIDLTSSSSYVFKDNFKDCYYYYYYCNLHDLFESSGKGNLIPNQEFNFYISDNSDTARTAYAQNSFVSFYKENNAFYGDCKVNFKKLIQDGGGSFNSTIKIQGGSAEQCVSNILTSLPPLIITGTLDTTAKKLTFTVRGKVYF